MWRAGVIKCQVKCCQLVIDTQPCLLTCTTVSPRHSVTVRVVWIQSDGIRILGRAPHFSEQGLLRLNPALGPEWTILCRVGRKTLTRSVKPHDHVLHIPPVSRPSLRRFSVRLCDRNCRNPPDTPSRRTQETIDSHADESWTSLSVAYQNLTRRVVTLDSLYFPYME